VIVVSETVLNTKTLPKALSKLISTEKVKVRETDGEIHLIPIKEPIDYISKLRGSLTNYPEMSVDKFLERKHADKELEE
jgi:hypothetical protein